MAVAAAPPRGRTLIAGASLVTVTMLAVSGGNYAMNLILARLLSPAEFGDVSLAVALVLTASVVAATLQFVAARSVAADPGSVGAVRRILLRAGALAGVGALLLVGGGAWFLSDLLRTSTPWMFVIIAVGLPIYFVQAVHRGILQGGLKFSRVAASYAAEAIVRIAVVVVLVAVGLGAVGAAVGILASFVASALVAWTRAPRTRELATARAALAGTALGATMMLVAQAVVNNVDVVIAKAAFAPTVAGSYVAAAVLCRSLYFVSWSVIQVVVPVIASPASSAASRRRAFVTAAGVIVALGAAASIASAAAAEHAVAALFGASYSGAAALLLPYCLCATALSLATLLAAVDLARGGSASAGVLLIGALVQIPVLVLAPTPVALIWLQAAGTGLILAAQVFLAMRRHTRAPTTPPRSLPAPTPTVSAETRTS